MEDKNVQKLLDMLFGMIDEAKGATFSSEKCVINRDEALDLLDEIRNKLPGELTKAQELMKSKEQYVDKANHEVRRMLDQAQDEAKRLREQAQAEAKRMLEKAQEDAKTIVSESETIQRPAVPGGQHLHRGRPAPDGGSYPGRPGRGAGVPRPLSQRLRRTDAGLPGEAQGRPRQALLRGVTNFPVHFCAFR